MSINASDVAEMRFLDVLRARRVLHLARIRDLLDASHSVHHSNKRTYGGEAMSINASRSIETQLLGFDPGIMVAEVRCLGIKLNVYTVGLALSAQKQRKESINPTFPTVTGGKQ